MDNLTNKENGRKSNTIKYEVYKDDYIKKLNEAVESKNENIFNELIGKLHNEYQKIISDYSFDKRMFWMNKEIDDQYFPMILAMSDDISNSIGKNFCFNGVVGEFLLHNCSYFCSWPDLPNYVIYQKIMKSELDSEIYFCFANDKCGKLESYMFLICMKGKDIEYLGKKLMKDLPEKLKNYFAVDY